MPQKPIYAIIYKISHLKKRGVKRSAFLGHFIGLKNMLVLE